MSLIGRLDDWRTTLRASAQLDGEPEPDEEAILNQFVYCAIADFLDAQLFDIESIDNSGTHYAETDYLAVRWTDLYAAQSVYSGVEPPKVERADIRSVPIGKRPEVA